MKGDSIAILQYSSAPPNDSTKRRTRFVWAGCFTALSVLLFAASLTQDYCYRKGDNSSHPWSCLILLLMGWMGLIDGYYEWLANPALLAAWLLMILGSRRGTGILMGLVSLGFALSFLRLKQLPAPGDTGAIDKITGYAIGYWLWIASIAVALIGCVVIQIVDFRRPTSTSG